MNHLRNRNSPRLAARRIATLWDPSLALPITRSQSSRVNRIAFVDELVALLAVAGHVRRLYVVGSVGEPPLDIGTVPTSTYGVLLGQRASIVLPHITHGSCARQRASSGSRGRDTCGNTGCCRARSHLVCVACVSDGAHLSRTPHALGRRARACGEPSGWFPNRPIRSSRRVAVSKPKPQFSRPNGTTCLSCLSVHTRLKTCRIRGMLLRDNATIATTNVPPRRLNPSA